MTVLEDPSLTAKSNEKPDIEQDARSMASGTQTSLALDDISSTINPENSAKESMKMDCSVDKGSDDTLAEDEKNKEDSEVKEEDIGPPLTTRQRRKKAILRTLYIIVFNAALPIGLYYALKPHIPPVWALVASTAPTIISVIVQAIVARRLDIFGVAVIFGFVLSVILAVVSQDPKLLLLRESFITAGVGGAMALTLIPFRYKNFELKPILYYIAKDMIPMTPVKHTDGSSEARVQFYWRTSSKFRYHIRVLSALDILTLECEFGLKLFYILHFDLDRTVVLSNITLTIVGIVSMLCTIYYALWLRKLLKKEEPELFAKDTTARA
ncbi:hypothetical protein INT43_006949, partial [Umbelopsis isabellina]